jgi:nicotinate-nucleotide pyrophosphorylase (carboxylating)
MQKTSLYLTNIKADVKDNVASALAEDIRSGDISAAIIPRQHRSQAKLISREAGVICGIDWFNESFMQLDSSIAINWLVADGDQVILNQTLCELSGNTRHLLTGERTALNFLQTLSGTATATATIVNLIKDTGTTLLDTRKTIPGLRSGQKYAVLCGGGTNHRRDLSAAYLIKENHISALGSIAACITKARELAPNKQVEIEVSSLAELEQAIAAQAHIIMLDNFSIADMRTACSYMRGEIKLEASGNINSANIKEVAATGVDYISLGTITKDCKALDLSLLLTAL